jgi:hypothetical protein
VLADGVQLVDGGAGFQEELGGGPEVVQGDAGGREGHEGGASAGDDAEE